jgi:hypothetical protein
MLPLLDYMYKWIHFFLFFSYNITVLKYYSIKLLCKVIRPTYVKERVHFDGAFLIPALIWMSEILFMIWTWLIMV